MSRPPASTTAPPRRNRQNQAQQQPAPPPPPTSNNAQRQLPPPGQTGAPQRTSSPHGQYQWMTSSGPGPPPLQTQNQHRGSFSSPITATIETTPNSRSARLPSASHPGEVTLGSVGTYGGGHPFAMRPSVPGPNFGALGGGSFPDGGRTSPRASFDHGQPMFRSPHAPLQPFPTASSSSASYLRPGYPPLMQPSAGQQHGKQSISMLYDSAQAGPSSLGLPPQPAQRLAGNGLAGVPAHSPEKEEEEDEYEDDDMGTEPGSVRGGRGGGRKKGEDGAEDDDELLPMPGTTATGRKRRPHATRRRVVQSCSECRRRKIKCDKKFPCGPCLLRGDQAQCHEVGMAEKNVVATPFTYATASDLAFVAQRLDALEAALTKTGALIPSDLDQYLRRAQRAESVLNPEGGPSAPTEALVDVERRLVKAEESMLGDSGRREIIDSPVGVTNALGPPPAPRSLPPPRQPEEPRRNGDSNVRGAVTSPDDVGDGDMDPQDDTEGAALTLEHLAFGRSTAEGAHAIPHFGPRGPSAISKHDPNNDYHLARPHPAPIQGPTPPGSNSGARIASGSITHTGSAGNSPAEIRRKSSILRPPSRGSANSVPVASDGVKRRDTLTASYGESLTDEEREVRIDALLDLIGPMDIFSLFYRKTDVGLRALTKVLPGRERGELLVRTYLEKVDWQNRCLHIPTFLRQCNDLWAIPHEMIVHEIALPFVALYYSVCCLGVQFMDTDEARKHFTIEEIRDLPDLYFNAARSCMWAADFIGQHAIENLQCLLLLGIFMNNRDRGEAFWALLGASIKMAQGLGLSRLGAEPTSTDSVKSSPMWTGRWESVIEREVGRRIWWNLVFMDWALAPSYNFSCSIHPDQIKTALPSNINDVDLIEGQPLRPQPLNVRTGMSFVLARIKFIQIMYRQICEANIHRHPPYSFVLSVDSELRKAMMELPMFFQPNSSRRTGSGAEAETDAEGKSTPPPVDHDPTSLIRYYEKVMLNLAIHSRMLRLHRPWLSRGYTDERFAYSKEQCIRAARASLRLMSDTHGTAAFLEKWWLPLFYVSVSGLVVIIDLLRTNRKDMHSRETEQKISEVRGALDQMRQIADVSHPSRSAVKVMEFLLAEVEERRRPPGSSSAVTGKRKAPDDDEADGLQRAVKKLIRQAQLETDSPLVSTHTFPETTPSSTSSHPHASVSPHHDPARDRPVFDAYPLLPSAATLQQRSDEAASSSAPAAGGSRKGNTNTGFSLLDFNFDTPPPSTQTLPHPPQRSVSLSMPNENTHPAQGYRPMSTQPIASPFPFQLDFDPASGNPFGGPFPTFNPDPSAPGPPQLDPSVEDLLANYFPTPQQQQNGANGGGMGNMNAQGWGTVPDDFLSRVFSFSWDTAPAGGAGVDANGMQGGIPPGGAHQGVAQASGQVGRSQGMSNIRGQADPRHRPSTQSTTQGQGGQAGAGGAGQQGAQGQGQGQGVDFVPFDWGTSSGGWMA